MRRWPSARRWSVAARAPAQCVAETAGMRSSSGIGGSTTTNGKPRVSSSRSSAADSEGVTRIAPSVVPRRSRSTRPPRGRARGGSGRARPASPARGAPRWHPTGSTSSSRRARTGSCSRPGRSSLRERPRATGSSRSSARAHGHHGLAGLRRDVGAIVDDARDGRDGDTGRRATSRIVARRAGAASVGGSRGTGSLIVPPVHPVSCNRLR